MHARLHLPVAGPGPARLLILLPAPATGDIALADRLSRCPFRPVVLVAHCRTPPDAISSVEWAADHAADLGAADSPIALIGDGPGACLSAAVARHAAADGWPDLDPVVLIDPPTPTDAIGAHRIDRRGGDVATVVAALLDAGYPRTCGAADPDTSAAAETAPAHPTREDGPR